jgi:hypothetical protein
MRTQSPLHGAWTRVKIFFKRLTEGHSMICESMRPVQEKKPLWSALLVLSAVTIAVYCVSFFNGFVWDDEFIIVKNPAIGRMTDITDLLLSPDVVKPYYRPLNRATYLLDYWLFGMNPSPFHAINIMIHLLNVFLVYLVCCKVTTDRVSAFITALIFAVHPINTESVNFISARNNLLSLLFSLASFLLFLRGKERWRGWSFFSAILFLFGLLCKETALMMLVVIAFYSFSLLSPRLLAELRKWVFSLLPYLVCVGGYLLLRSYALRGIMGTGPLADGLAGRLAQNYYIIPDYLRLFLFPFNLTIFHTVPKAGILESPVFLLGWAAIMALIWLMVRWHNRAAIFGLLWVAVNYIPISNIIPIPSWPMAERYMYIPAAGLCLIAGELFGYLHTRFGKKGIVWVGVCIVVIALAASTVKRTMEWKDDISLFKSVIKNDPASTVGHLNLGNALLDRNDLAGAKLEWLKTLKIDPGHSEALTQMGTLSANAGDLQQAEQYYLAALHSDVTNAMAHYNLGKLYEMKGNRRNAVEHFESALRYLPVTYGKYKEEIERRVVALRAHMLGQR